ncbi:MAG: type I-E CRISPR-associated protein Cas5/CasD [Deltaproteobacteria bacterium]|nr:MAG: type I-E CRISPR-associated protein Cas5/CasD [Deltaproteobacteria bacterium]RLB95742.1 MAG: type I-E CRISPR-associated protein Cas5/CasD [Deltaproteobacteria bacterium]
MFDSKNWLTLYLDAPMQSWGYQSRFHRRTTLPYPTKSGIIGMLCAAMGVPKSDKVMISRLAGLRMYVYVLSAVRRMTDFHTVGGGYDPKTERGWIPRKADGGKPSTVVTHREYLLGGAKFGVLLNGNTALLGDCETALADPKWGVWFGRKSCIPASPICQGRFGSKEEARRHLEAISGSKAIRRVEEVLRFEDGTDTLLDVPVDFSTRDFTVRRVADEAL